ncbi:histidine-type phosphatase [Sphingomonas immobilis]|uniref:Histidine-type phosphatase n=1 Tax=Sphingomonas immobilis TaxID=3063997 RepID=A0ABT8ZV26_9SPHN|nr:histidine-type phosphatase [Sphingomonas sp. CA1-15]MDO7840845.1 histidine-type phosphatase [Sphingomonas sp. CA1-15]
MWRSGLIAAVLLAGAADAQPPAPPKLTVERVVLLMRHGVRPPTKAPAMPARVTPERWPEWPVAPGYLTPHGADAVTALGVADRAGLTRSGLLAVGGCPKPGTIAIIADSDQRTIATADAWLKGVAPGCAASREQKPQGEDDPLFGPLGNGATIDADAANAAVKAAIGPGGLAAADRKYAPLLKRLDTILCGKPRAGCGVSGEPTTLVPATPTSRPKIDGALDTASTAAQILLLEYADGKPLSEIGWGRASAADVTALSEFHALEFRLLARPLPVARANMALLNRKIDAALNAADGALVTMISAHDTQIANFGGLIGGHWHVPGFAEDDPAPGGAIVIERVRDAKGAAFVRVKYRAQPLGRLRAGGAGTFEQPMTIAGCGTPKPVTLCPAERFAALLGTK